MCVCVCVCVCVGGGGGWGQCINKLVLRELEAVLGGGGGMLINLL